MPKPAPMTSPETNPSVPQHAPRSAPAAWVSVGDQRLDQGGTAPDCRPSATGWRQISKVVGLVVSRWRREGPLQSIAKWSVGGGVKVHCKASQSGQPVAARRPLSRNHAGSDSKKDCNIRQQTPRPRSPGQHCGETPRTTRDRCRTRWPTDQPRPGCACQNPQPASKFPP